MTHTLTPITKGSLIKTYGEEQAEKLIQLINQMKVEPTAFSYQKKDETIRTATGTVNIDLVPGLTTEEITYLKETFNIESLKEGEYSLFNDLGSAQSFYYYDLDKKGIRQFKPEMLISISGD